ncbi:MAG: hypothetical protein Q4E01_03290 [Actinomycetaceae bacterium]|nr:hypothetical protein [Actinomycetaceae bacterium]
MNLEEWEEHWLEVSELPIEERLVQLRAAEAELFAALGEEAGSWRS